MADELKLAKDAPFTKRTSDEDEGCGCPGCNIDHALPKETTAGDIASMMSHFIVAYGLTPLQFHELSGQVFAAAVRREARVESERDEFIRNLFGSFMSMEGTGEIAPDGSFDLGEGVTGRRIKVEPRDGETMDEAVARTMKELEEAEEAEEKKTLN